MMILITEENVQNLQLIETQIENSDSNYKICMSHFYCGYL